MSDIAQEHSSAAKTITYVCLPHVLIPRYIMHILVFIYLKGRFEFLRSCVIPIFVIEVSKQK